MERRYEVLFVGMGAVGTMVAYAIQNGGKANITAVLRSNYCLVKDKGFNIDSIDHGKDIREWRPTTMRNTIPDLSEETGKRYDYVVIATKNTPDVGPNLIDLVEPAITAGDTAVVLMQNGLNIEKPFQSRFPQNAIISGIQLLGAEETSPGTILHTEPDICQLGLFESSTADSSQRVVHLSQTHKFVEIYNACGKVDCQFDKDVKFTRWRKLVYNAAYNPISAILGMDVTRMRINEHIIDNLVKPIAKEIIEIARADGVHLPDELAMYFITVDKLESWFMPSMGQDAAKGNYIEFENIVGEPMREAQKLSVPCPTLTTVYGILKGMQTKTMELKGILKSEISQANRYRG